VSKVGFNFPTRERYPSFRLPIYSRLCYQPYHSLLKHSLLYLRKPKGSGFFLKPFWLPFLHLGPAQVTPRELVYRLVAIVKSLGFGIFISILMLFYRYKCSRGRNGRFDCYRPDVFFIVYFVNRIFLVSHKTWPCG
jgi:hypothetical protein